MSPRKQNEDNSQSDSQGFGVKSTRHTSLDSRFVAYTAAQDNDRGCEYTHET
jgi:hypothetical protein